MQHPNLVLYLLQTTSLPALAATQYMALAGQPGQTPFMPQTPEAIQTRLSAAPALLAVPVPPADPSAEVTQLKQMLSLAHDLYQHNLLKPALKIYHQTLQQVTAEGNVIYTGVCLMGMGQIYICWQRYFRAESYCRAAAHILADTEAVTYQARAFHLWGLACYHQGQAVEAISCFQQALNLWQDTRDSFAEANTLVYLGRAYICQQKYWFVC